MCNASGPEALEVRETLIWGSFTVLLFFAYLVVINNLFFLTQQFEMRQLIQAVVSSTNFGPCYPERQTWHSILIHCGTLRPPLYALIWIYSLFDKKKFLNSISSGVSFDRLAGFGVSVTRCIKVHQRHSQAPQGTYALCVWRINVFINVSSILRTCILFDYLYIEALVVRDNQKLSSPSSAVTSKDWAIFTEVRLDPNLIS